MNELNFTMGGSKSWATGQLHHKLDRVAWEIDWVPNQQILLSFKRQLHHKSCDPGQLLIRQKSERRLNVC